MGISILTGILAAVIVFLIRLASSYLSEWAAYFPWGILAIGVVGVFFQKVLLLRHRGRLLYRGLSDFFLNIHLPKGPRSIGPWGYRSLISFLLGICGGAIGPEGAAAEFAQAANSRVRPRYSWWFEQKRRTDVACSLAGSIAATFGAPFAGVLISIELGIGGRSIAAASSALAGFLVSKILYKVFAIDQFDVTGAVSISQALFQLSSWKYWCGLAVVGLVAGLGAVFLLYFVRWMQIGFKNVSQDRVWVQTLVAASILALLFLIENHHWSSVSQHFENLIWLKFESRQVPFYLLTQCLILAVILGGFGTIGVFWPLLSIGGFLGATVCLWVLKDIPEFTSVATLASGAAFCGAFLGVPFSAVVLVFEMTQNTQLVLPCLVAVWFAHQTRKTLKASTLIHEQLKGSDLTLHFGRSLEILQTISVREAMVTDFVRVHDHELVSEVRNKAMTSKYPVLPVVNSQGAFVGLLTIDMLQGSDAPDRKENKSAAENSDLDLHTPSKIMEVKDLLIRGGYRSPYVQDTDCLSAVVGLLDEIPCMPVLSEEGKVEGLIFVFSVRFAYDREVGRRSFSFLRGQPRGAR